ncbi:DUF6188 family protein [Gryllotalpicola ginsengisoli]|uniref:DUF6188 family protein n=1 Tax=Gryllotalpicola ginsengisoli TaxID=444608 RepID=UPI0003B53BF3|nr:DUF6188 family protein [Gryllotalpicola ginsengisoli]
MTTIDLGLSGIEVTALEFDPNGIQLQLSAEGADFWVAGDLKLSDDQGDVVWRPQDASSSPATLRLLGGIIGASITASTAESTDSSVDLEFDSGLKVHYDPMEDQDWELWESTAPDGRGFLCSAPGPLTGPDVPDESEPLGEAAAEAPEEPTPEVSVEPEWDEGTGQRLIDLELSERVYGVLVFADGIELHTRIGAIYIVGPFRLSWPDGTTAQFDSGQKERDKSTGKVLDYLIDNVIVLATVTPETSALSVQFEDGGVLQWTPTTPDMAQFRARHRNGWEFHSRGDGTIYWYGGPKGTHPKFLAGGPRKTD